MNWLILAFLAPLLWAFSNFIDKYLVEKHFKGGIGSLFLYSSIIIPAILCLLIFVFKPEVLEMNLVPAILMGINGIIYITYLLPYYKALDKADASSVVPIFQSIPVFTYILALFVLGEALTQTQIIASTMILAGAVGISLKFEGKKIKFKFDVVMLMLLASLMVSINSVLFKFFALDFDYWTVFFWECVGILIFGIFLFIFANKYRREFISSLKKNGSRVLSLNALNEIIDIIAIMVFSYAWLLAPIALVSVINGFQPFFVFILGIILTLFFPKIIKEDISKGAILQKIVFIGLMIWGAYLLSGNY